VLQGASAVDCHVCVTRTTVEYSIGLQHCGIIFGKPDSGVSELCGAFGS